MTKVLLSANTDWYLYNFRRSFASFLRSQGFEVVLVCPPGEYIHRLTDSGFRWVSWELGRQTVAPWRELPALLSLAKIYRQEQPDLVHHHTIKPVLYGSLAARLAGVPAIVNSITGRGYVFISKETRASLIKQITRPLYRLAFSRAGQAAIFENDEDRQYFIREKLIPAERTWLIAGVGVDTDLFAPNPEPSGAPIILQSSRMLWDKGVGVLVEAARLLHSTGQVARRFGGRAGPWQPGLDFTRNNYSAWDREGVIEWWGWQAEMSQVYQQAHIVALPSAYGEGVPTVLLEAAACGRPLVASDIPGCRAIVIDQVNGLLVPANDPPALAEALAKLLADPALRGRMGAASRQLVMEKFTVELVNRSTLTVYLSLLNKSSASG